MDGASGLPLPERGGKTCLELARTSNLDALAKDGIVGLVQTVPQGMEPSSACACMSLLGYDPRIYYRGRSAIEAKSLGIPINEGEVVFRCNLVSVQDGKMASYSAGYISTEEARLLIEALNDNLGNENVRFYPGISYRHICKIKGREDTLSAMCTPPHDIPGKPIAEFMPRGPGSDFLRDLMWRSEMVLKNHPVNLNREAQGNIPANMIWLFWGSSHIPELPPFQQVYNLNAALTSGVDLLRGLALMVGMEILNIPGVTDGLDNDYAGQINGALNALKEKDLVVVHVEAPDEAAHSGSINKKIEAIERIDQEMVSRLRFWQEDRLRVLIMPDHSTPIVVRTHTDAPVPFLLWGVGFTGNGAKRLTETEAKRTGVFIKEGHRLILKLLFLNDLNNVK